MLRQQNVKTMYFKTLNPKAFKLKTVIGGLVFLCGNMQMLQILNEFAWRGHVGILDGVKKNQIQGVCSTTINNLLTLRVYVKTEYNYTKKNNIDLLY